MAQKSLSELKPGDRATITKIGNDGGIRRRILDMGVVPGSEIEVLRVAPLGDPIEFRIRGYNLTLRRSESQHITVEA